MELTRIGNQNWNIFSSVVYDAYAQNAPEVLRIGAIEDGKVCGAISISFFTSEDQAFIDAIYVVPEFRRRGFGTALIEEAKRLASAQVHCLEAEFYGDSEELKNLFEKAGFACIPGEPIFDFDVKKLLSNRQYAQYCKKKLSGIATYDFTNMTQTQKNRVFELLGKNGERNTETNTEGFAPDLSIVIYRGDDMRSPKACLIASECQNKVNIAQLYGSGKNNPKYILATIFGFTDAVSKRGGAKSFNELGMIAAHPGVKKVFELLFGKRMTASESQLIHAISYIDLES